MYVGKQFDIVLGVDIHIIQPPGPVPPVPVPHPFVGIVYDPMEFVPILGASISTNGIPRAQAGTTVKATPPHFPIGGVFVKPPSNDGEIYMGSISVPIEGEPFPYLGCPVLTCQDAGMMPVPRPMRKSKSKPKSMVLPTSVLLPIPKGGVNFSPTPPSISIAGLLVKIGLKFLGKIAKKLIKKKKPKPKPPPKQSAYETAKNGGKHEGFYKNYKDKPPEEIKKGIKSMEKNIEEHQNLMRDPDKYMKQYGKGDWKSLDPRQQEALLTKKWPGDIQRAKEQKEILEGILNTK